MIKYTDLTEQQKEAISLAVDWFKRREHQLFVIGGYAGTGKSTILPFIAGELGIEDQTAYCSFTGKAALVLTQKGANASTIHKLIYNTYEREDGTLAQTRKKELEEPYRLIVIDEYSMINDYIMQDLISFGVPILMFGDPGQLPPPRAIRNSYVSSPDFVLEDIHRQAEDSAILKASYQIRKGIPVPYQNNKDLTVLPKRMANENYLFRDLAYKADQVICGTNRMRHSLNNKMRRGLGRTSTSPVVGDKVICGRNNWDECLRGEYYLVNGSSGHIKYLGVNKYFDPMMDFAPDYLEEGSPDSVYTDLLYKPHLLTGGKERKVPKWKERKMNEFEYGYAITCHKAQGSEYDTVVIWEERFGGTDHRKWLYTALTRGKKKVILFR